jgi:hypothetical protein
MTSTDRPVARVTRSAYSTLYAERRQIVVRIAPGDLLEFREKGRRDWFLLAIDDAFGVAVKCRAGFRLCFIPGPRKKKAE